MRSISKLIQSSGSIAAAGCFLITAWFASASIAGKPADLVIDTVAGTGVAGFNGDNRRAVEAQLNGPTAVVIDDAGNLYIADMRNHRIRRVDTIGIITTVAGDGTPGFNGDGRPAALAELNQPLGLALDSKGNLFIADTLNQRIRRVDTSGMITTVAGTGEDDFSGDGGPAVNATFSRPVGLAVDALGNIYVADVFNQRIRKIDTGGKISTVAGNGMDGFSGDSGRAIDAQLTRPRDVAVDDQGILYIADTDNQRVRRVGLNGIISTVAGNGLAGFKGDGGSALEASLNSPRGVTVTRSGQILISDMANSRIRMVDRQGLITTIAGNGMAGFSGDGGSALQAGLGRPRGVRAGPQGAIYIADLDNQRVRLIK